MQWYKSKSRKSEAEDERERQRKGGALAAHHISPRFLEGIDDPEMMVLSTYSGSMTQEAFFHFVQHFIALLPKDHGHVILFLDGHGSRWSVPTLRLLTENNVFPFFFASHTSIWAQPNDAGVNKRFQWAVEMCVRKARRSVGTPNVKYFKQALSKAMHLFRETEIWELVSH